MESLKEPSSYSYTQIVVSVLGVNFQQTAPYHFYPFLYFYPNAFTIAFSSSYYGFGSATKSGVWRRLLDVGCWIAQASAEKSLLTMLS